MTRTALLCVSLAALAQPLEAQEISLLLGGVHTEYADSITGNAGTISLRLGGSSTRAIGVADASFTQFVDGVFVTQGSAYGTFLLTRPNWNGPNLLLAGGLDGMLKATKYPSAKYMKVAMEGDASGQVAGLEKVEVYEIGNTVYFQNPQDGAWMSLPAGLVYSMLPSDIAISPEAYINVPVTAVRQSGLETINGVITRRYTFGRDDLVDGDSYDRVKGTIWVAVRGNYVVRYETTITGDLQNLVPGGMELMEDGTVTMAYEISDIDSDFTIEPPIRNRGLNLGSLLSGLGSFR